MSYNLEDTTIPTLPAHSGRVTRSAFTPARLAVALLASLLGVIASTILLMEKIELWKNPDYIPSCSWNPLFSCQGPMMSWQSSALFGLPNPLIGAVGFAVAGVVALLLALSSSPAWLRKVWWVGNTAALGYVFWLMSQSLWDIQALCIYCMVVWAVTIALFWVSTAVVADGDGSAGSSGRWWASWVPLSIATMFGVVTVILVTFRSFFFDFLL